MTSMANCASCKQRGEELLKRLRELLGIQAVYDIAVALRGPDFFAPNLKYIFTCRLRYLAGVDVFSADVRVSREVALEVVERAAREAREWVNTYRSSFNHWLDHMEVALRSMEVLLWKAGGKGEAIRELEELRMLLQVIWDYAFDFTSMERLAEFAKQLSIVEL